MAPRKTSGAVPAAADPTPDTDAAPATTEPAEAGAWEFTGPYPVVLMALGREVAPGDVVEFPAGPPDRAHWRPAAAPSTEES